MPESTLSVDRADLDAVLKVARLYLIHRAEADLPVLADAQRAWSRLRMACDTEPFPSWSTVFCYSDHNEDIRTMGSCDRCGGTQRDVQAQCGTCGLIWNDGVSTGVTPTPAGRCPNEANHLDNNETANVLRSLGEVNEAPHD